MAFVVNRQDDELAQKPAWADSHVVWRAIERIALVDSGAIIDV